MRSFLAGLPGRITWRCTPTCRAGAALHLQLPAPLRDNRFLGSFKSAGSAAHFYHSLFSNAIGQDSLAQITCAIERGATFETMPEAPGVRAMFVRNAKVASTCTAVIAYTFGEGEVPADGGTKDTWDKARSESRTHICLNGLSAPCRVMSRRERFNLS